MKGQGWSWCRVFLLEKLRAAEAEWGERTLSQKPDFSTHYQLPICFLIKCITVLPPHMVAARTSPEP